MTFNEQSIVRLSDLSYDDVDALAQWCRTAVQYDSLRYKVEQERWRLQSVASKAKRIAQAAPRARKDALKLNWLRDNLKEGDLLKMLGCRDGHGYREFIRWTRADDLICWQWETVRAKNNYRVFTPTTRGVQITTHMPNKVSKIRIDGNFVSIPA